MSKFKDINWVGLFVYFIYPIAMIGFIVMLFVESCNNHFFGKTPQAPDAITKVDTVRQTDTVFISQPVAITDTIVRWQKVYLYRDSDNKQDSTSLLCQDSTHQAIPADSSGLFATLPITQRHYVDTTYEAWVSGYEASLDSIRIFRQQLTVTKTITERKRWSYGLQGGMYLTPRGFQPGIGVGVTYTFPP